MSKISKVIARQIFDSRGNPTIEAEVFSKNISSSAICPSGASTGIHEAIELRDNHKDRFFGKGVLKSVNFIQSIILDTLQGLDLLQTICEILKCIQKTINLENVCMWVCWCKGEVEWDLY